MADQEKRTLLSRSPSVSPSYGAITRVDIHAPGQATSFHNIQRYDNLVGNTSNTCGISCTHPTPKTTGSEVDQGGSSPTPKSKYEAYQNHEDEEELVAVLQQHEQDRTDTAADVMFIINLSLVVNIFLFVCKVAAFVMSGSLSVAASVVDSFLDLLVQAIIAIANHGKYSQDKALYPAGKSRIEPVGIIVCAVLMFLAALELVARSFSTIYEGVATGVVDGVSIDRYSITVIAGVILIKACLWLYCRARASLSDSVATLSFDHLNDVLSNAFALVAIILVLASERLWWSDALGCIVISLYIAKNWYEIATQKVNELVGRAADDEFISNVTRFVNQYHPQCLQLDIIRAYHFGMKFLVELEVILPASMSVKEAHDIALGLQQAIERMENVERAFVHVDYKSRNIDEHDIAGKLEYI